MSESRIDFTLSLIPIIAGGEAVSESKPAVQDDWLENSDESLIHFDIEKKNEAESVEENDGLNQVLTQLSKHPNQRIFKNEKLEIKALDQGFELVQAEGNVILKPGDIIRLPRVLLRVEIKEEHLVKHVPENDMAIPAPEIEDIWSSSQEQAYHGNRFADPFSQQPDPLKRQANSNIQDPLGFLYHEPKSERQQYVLSGNIEHDALNINTQVPYHPSSSTYPAESFDRHYSKHEENMSEGNVLNDLGINESGSTIAQRNYNSGKTSYQEQSPMDMLDEYLDEHDSISYDTDNSYISPHQNQSKNLYDMSLSHTSPKQNSVSQVCKKLLKIFVD